MDKNIEVAEHLGGGEGRCWIDEGSLDWAINKFNIKSMIDVGCGQACQVELARSKGLEAIGVEGDPRVLKDDLQIHFDFTEGVFQPPKQYDLAWSVEFLEHVYEKYIPNYMPAFQSAKYVIATHALPGKPGNHHVNCQIPEYWHEKFDEYGYRYDDELTRELRKNTTMGKYFMRKHGLFFVKK